MDCVYFPNIYSITLLKHRTIDVFATISESLEVNFHSETSVFPRQQIQSIMQEMVTYRDNTEFPEINKLLYLLTEMVLGVVESHQVDSVESHQIDSVSRRKSVAERIQNKFLKLVSSSDSIEPIPTFDHVKTDEYYTDVDEMYKLMRKHKHIYREIQRQQEIERNLLDDIKFNLIDRIQSGLISMKYIIATQTNKLYEILPHIDEFDCRLAAESIIEKLSSKYQYSSPQEFHIANGFNAKLPDIRFVSCKTAIQIMTEQPSEPRSEQKKEERNNNNVSCQDNQFKFLSNTYVKTKDLSEKPNECFVQITKGMIVKLKIATDESKVAFGWYKPNPWNQKRWGFFCKSDDNLKRA